MDTAEFPVDFPLSGNFPETNPARTASTAKQSARWRFSTETDRRNPAKPAIQRVFAFLEMG